MNDDQLDSEISGAIFDKAFAESRLAQPILTPDAVRQLLARTTTLPTIRIPSQPPPADGELVADVIQAARNGHAGRISDDLERELRQLEDADDNDG